MANINHSSVGVISQPITVAEVAANITAEQTFTVPGLALGDFVAVNKPALTAGLAVAGARVSAANQIAITFTNPTAGALTPTAAEMYTILVVRAQ